MTIKKLENSISGMDAASNLNISKLISSVFLTPQAQRSFKVNAKQYMHQNQTPNVEKQPSGISTNAKNLEAMKSTSI